MTLTLPFASQHEPSSWDRLALFHLFTPYPKAIEIPLRTPDYYDRHYLNPKGEPQTAGGVTTYQHQAYGGLLRDRPRREDATGDALEDMRVEFRQIKAMLGDGADLDLLNVNDGNTHWARAHLAMQAAADEGCVVALKPDMTTLTPTATTGHTPASLAARLAILAKYPSALRTPDGRLVVSPFKTENRPPDWWRQMLADLAKLAGPTSFWPTFNDWRTNMDRFAAISDRFSAWGERNPVTGYSAHLEAAKKAHALGKGWMAPVAFQDVRPKEGRYWEARGTSTIRATIRAAIDGAAEGIFVNTLNDHVENSGTGPTENHGDAPGVVLAGGLEEWRTGKPPVIVRDCAVLTSRTHTFAAPTPQQTKRAALQAGSSQPAVDEVEAVVYATAAGTLSLSVGGQVSTHQVGAGENVIRVPLRNGPVDAVLYRHGDRVVEVDLGVEVTSTPSVQDLSYWGAAAVSDVVDPTLPLLAQIAELVEQLADTNTRLQQALADVAASEEQVAQLKAALATKQLLLEGSEAELADREARLRRIRVETDVVADD